MLSWPYIAGFFDGEGCVRIYTRSGKRICAAHARIHITQTGNRGRVLLENMAEFLSALDINGVVRRAGVPRRSNHAQAWTLTFDKRESARKFLIYILPHLTIKKVEAQDVLRYLTMYPKISRNSAVLSMLLRESHPRNKGRI